jgi:uncharacterized protein (DUF2147 family)
MGKTRRSFLFERLRGLGAGFIASVALALPAIAGAPIEGTWRTLNGTEITVAPCGAEFCGTLSWIVIPEQQRSVCQLMPKDEFGSLILDYNNPDRTQQTRSLLGAQMMKVMPTRDPNAYSARIYNAEDGSTNDVLLWVVKGTTLRLGGGCVASMCLVTQDWPRVGQRETVPDYTCG